MSYTYNVDPVRRYNGPEFDEFCISQKGYLPASRDRSECITCALSNLCQAGFERQVALITQGEDPSLTKDCEQSLADLPASRLIENLNPQQVEFVKLHIPGLAKELGNV